MPHRLYPAPISEQEFKERWLEQLRTATDHLDASEIAASLDLSPNAYYMRRRGEAAFSAFHFALLSERFGLTTDVEGRSTFRLTLGQRPGTLFDSRSYVGNLRALVNHFTKALDPAFTDIVVSSSDIPVFHLFSQPELAALKLYYFEATHNHDREMPFDLNGVLDERRDFIEGVGEVAAEYTSVASTEVWGPEPLMTVLAQLLRIARARGIERKDADRVFDALQRVVATTSDAIQHKKKANGGTFELRINSLYSTSSLFALRNLDDERFCLTFDNPHYLYSAEAETCSYFKEHFERVYQQSDAVGRRGVISSKSFCNILRKKIKQSQSRVEDILSRDHHFC